MYHNERAASNELSLVPVVDAAQLVRNYKASPRDFFFSLLRDLFTVRHVLAFLPSSSRSQKSNIKRDRPERASPSPSTPSRRGSWEYFAMLIAKWAHHFSCTSARECMFILCLSFAFFFFFFFTLYVIILITASWKTKLGKKSSHGIERKKIDTVTSIM